MRIFASVLVATSLFVSSAFAANQTVSTLPAGKPAGVGQAALLGADFGLILVGLGVVIGGVILAASGCGNCVTGTTTTSTSTTGLP